MPADCHIPKSSPYSTFNPGHLPVTPILPQATPPCFPKISTHAPVIPVSLEHATLFLCYSTPACTSCVLPPSNLDHWTPLYLPPPFNNHSPIILLFYHPQYSSEHPLQLWTQPDDICTSPLHLSLTLPWALLLFIQLANPFHPPFNHFGTSVPSPTPGVPIELPLWLLHFLFQLLFTPVPISFCSASLYTCSLPTPCTLVLKST